MSPTPLPPSPPMHESHHRELRPYHFTGSISGGIVHHNNFYLFLLRQSGGDGVPEQFFSIPSGDHDCC